VQAMVTTGTLTAAQLTDAQTQIAALNAQVAALNAASTTPSAAVSTVTSILTTLSAYLPLILPIIGLLASPAAKPDTPIQASLRAHLAALHHAAGV